MWTIALFDILRAAKALRQILDDGLEPPSALPHYNACPGTWITAAWHPDEDEPLALGQLWWGFRQHRATGKAPHPIKAKSEGVASSRYFRSAFAKHRCLIPSDGWFEWLVLANGKQPHFITRTDRQSLWLAGIWAQRPDGNLGCAILTEPANDDSALIEPADSSPRLSSTVRESPGH